MRMANAAKTSADRASTTTFGYKRSAQPGIARPKDHCVRVWKAFLALRWVASFFRPLKEGYILSFCLT